MLRDGIDEVVEFMVRPVAASISAAAVLRDVIDVVTELMVRPLAASISSDACLQCCDG